MKCVAASVSGRGGDPIVVRSCRVIKSGFVGVERSVLSVVSLEVEVIVRWAVGDNDKSHSEAPEVVGCGVVFVRLSCSGMGLSCLFMGSSCCESAYVSDLVFFL
ncbi:unnamed protein product [Brassica oleracea]